MKYPIRWILSILLTFIVWSLSLQSGQDSGQLSTSFTASIYQWILSVSPNFNLSLETMHVVVRKVAHIGSYGLLGISWTMTLWPVETKRKIQVIVLGLVVSVVGELLQLLADSRGPSLVDAFVFNYGGYLLTFGLIMLVFRKTFLQNQEKPRF